MTSDLAIVVSRADEASVHIGQRLREIVSWDEAVDESKADAAGGGAVYRHENVVMRTFEKRHLAMVDVAAAFDSPRLIVFASRHAGDTGPLLTAHHTGNFGAAEYGGESRALARAAPAALAAVYDAFLEYAPSEYDIGLECTHHGPTAVGAPSLFVELGSDATQWEDPAGARAVARSILALADVDPDTAREFGRCRHLVGFGGGHYVPRFERIVAETDWAVGHVAADWCLDEIGEPTAATDVIDAAFAASAAEYAVLEADRPALQAVIEDLGYRVVSETWVRETDGVALHLVERLESMVCTVDAGLRFGTPARESGGTSTDPILGAVPDTLSTALNAVDQDATRQAIHEHALAYETDHGGSRATGAVVVPDRAAGRNLQERFVAVLAAGYDAVELDGDTIVAHRSEFDPELARKAGVEPGPDFGSLAEGESVTVDGDHVDPGDVTVERERRLPATIVTA